MDGIFESDNVNPKLDVFSTNKGSATCAPSFMSTRGGFMCLPSAQVHLLQTRGGNA